ncbi:MAG: MFS transporter [Mycobacteriales bacterium]
MSDDSGIDPLVPVEEEARQGARWVSRARGLAIDISPLRTSPAYRRVWIGDSISIIGSSMSMVAIPVQVYDITGSSFFVGLLGLVTLVPLIAFGLMGGAIADAVERRKLLITTQLLMTGASVLLVVQALAGNRNIWLLYALTALMSAVVAVDMPTRRAIAPLLLPPDQLAPAAALGQVVFNLGMVVGPLLAGVIIGIGGVELVYAVDALSFVASIVAAIALPQLPIAGGGTKAGAASVLEGFRFLRGRPAVLMTFVVDIIAMVFGMPRALFPELARERFGGGDRATGLLYAAPAVGAFVGALLGGWIGRINRQGLAVVVAIVGWGAAVVGFGLSSWLWIGCIFLAAAGFADMVSAVYRTAILQVATPPALLGRLNGVFIVVVAGGPRLGDLEAGAVDHLFGATVSVVSGGVACIVGVAIAAALGRRFLHYDARDPHA